MGWLWKLSLRWCRIWLLLFVSVPQNWNERKKPWNSLEWCCARLPAPLARPTDCRLAASQYKELTNLLVFPFCPWFFVFKRNEIQKRIYLGRRKRFSTHVQDQLWTGWWHHSRRLSHQFDDCSGVAYGRSQVRNKLSSKYQILWMTESFIAKKPKKNKTKPKKVFENWSLQLFNGTEESADVESISRYRFRRLDEVPDHRDDVVSQLQLHYEPHSAQDRHGHFALPSCLHNWLFCSHHRQKSQMGKYNFIPSYVHRINRIIFF